MSEPTFGEFVAALTEPRAVDELAARRGTPREDHEQLRLAALELDGEPVAAFAADNAFVIDKLRQATSPIPGRDGWRIDANGGTWYSSHWIGLHE